MPVALANIRSELLPGLFDVRGSYDMIPRQWDKVFKTHKSNMAVERSTQMAFVALPFLKEEGAATQFDNGAGERFTWSFVHIEVALGYAITRKAIDDNLYKAQFNPTNLKLQESFAQFKEIQGANILNLSTTYQSSIGGDGVALLSTAHPFDGGTWANTSSTPKDLNESTLLADMTNVRTLFVNERGLRILSRARQLIVPPALEAVAIRLTKTELRPGTADNDVNAILTLSGGLPEGFIVLDFLTSQFAWFLKTNIEGLIHMLRIPYESDLWVDNITDNLLPIHVDEPVITDRGQVALGDIKIGDMVLTRRGRFRNVQAIQRQGMLPTVNVKTVTGRTVRSAPNHTFLTLRGWVEAASLTPEDLVAVGRSGCDYDQKEYGWTPPRRSDDGSDTLVMDVADTVPAEWETVATVERADDGECRCMTVEDDSSFTAGGLVVHNCKAYERYSFGYNDPRALWGETPSS